MTDPVTLGTLGALALSKATEALAAGTVGEVVKDAYQHLKTWLSKRSATDVPTLESHPKSAARQAVVGELIDNLRPADLEEVRALVQQLTVALQSEASQHPIGIELDSLSAMNVALGNVRVGSGTGIKAGHVNLTGDLTVSDLTVGDVGKVAR